MTEQRYYYGNCGDTEVFDREKPTKNPFGIEFVDRLNEQDAKIKELEHRIHELEHDV